MKEPLLDSEKKVVRERVLRLLNERSDEDPAQFLMTIKDDIEEMINNKK